MDENRDEVLNELIKYYDSSAAEETSGTEDDIGIDATRVIHPASGKPAEEMLGDTVVVSVAKKQTPAAPEQENLGSTVRIPAGSAETERTQPVQEEVFGNLGLDGRPISSRPNQTSRIEPERQTAQSHAEAARNTVRINDADDEEYKMKRSSRRSRNGIWNRLKPLWASLIICSILAGLLELFTNDHPFFRTYQRNFKYNMSVIMGLFGIESDNGAEKLPVITTGETQRILAGTASEKIIVAAADPEIKDNGELKIKEKNYNRIKGKKLSIPFEGAGSSGFAAFDKGVVCAKSNYICFYNKKGEKKWESETTVSSPMLDARGSYVVIAAKGGTRVSLYKGKKLQYTVDVKNNIRRCSVSEKGDVVLVTEKQAYKGSVTVLNKKGEEVFVWSSGVNYITSATVLKSRRIAVSLVNGDSAVTSYVMMFDIKYPDPVTGAELKNSLIYDLESCGNNILVSGDNCMALINRNGEIVYDKRYDDVRLTHSANDGKGCRVLSFNRDNLPFISVYDKKGGFVKEAETESVPDCVDIWGDTVLYNNGHSIICGAAEDDIKTAYTAPMKVKQLILINGSTYLAVYENRIEMIEI